MKWLVYTDVHQLTGSWAGTFSRVLWDTDAPSRKGAQLGAASSQQVLLCPPEPAPQV